MDQARLKEVLSDEEFVKELFAMEEPEQVQDALDDRGISLTVDEVRQIGDYFSKVASGEIPQETAMSNGELSEEELGGVAGGLDFSNLGQAIYEGAGVDQVVPPTGW